MLCIILCCYISDQWYVQEPAQKLKATACVMTTQAQRTPYSAWRRKWGTLQKQMETWSSQSRRWSWPRGSGAAALFFVSVKKIRQWISRARHAQIEISTLVINCRLTTTSGPHPLFAGCVHVPGPHWVQATMSFGPPGSRLLSVWKRNKKGWAFSFGLGFFFACERIGVIHQVKTSRGWKIKGTYLDLENPDFFFRVIDTQTWILAFIRMKFL